MDLDALRHSCAHILASAIKELYSKAKFAIGPSIEDGFYYDFDNLEITEQDLVKIEKRMHEIVNKKLDFKKVLMPRKKALEFLKNEPYKLDLLKDIPGEKVQFYQHGNYYDLCKGGHLKNTSEIKAFKLLKTAKAYWKGDSRNKQLTRIYGTAWNTEQDLKSYIERLEEAEKRDHRKLGKDLELFFFHEYSPGAPFWLPNGMVIFNELEDYWRKIHHDYGYEEINTPIVVKEDLFKQSGHLEHYKDNMFKLTLEKENYYLKPMNCPEATIVYSSKLRSYKDLPIRLSEIGRLHRNELSGALGGMFRVRQITMDDAHIFCLDKKTELLTQSGWKTMNEIKEGELAFSYDTKKDICKLKPIKKVIKYDYKGKMLWLKNQDALDCLITPEHRVLCKIRTTFSNRKQGLSKWKFIQAGDMPSGIYIPTPRRLETNSKCKIDWDLLSILGWLITDGNRSKEGGYLTIVQATSNPNKPSLYRTMVKTIKRRFPESKIYLRKKIKGHKESAIFYLGVKAGKEISNWIGDKIHRIPRSLLEMASYQQLNKLFNSLVEGDGTTTRRSKNGYVQVRFYCGYNKELADDFQELCTRLGFSSTKKYVPQNSQIVILISFKRKQNYVRKVQKQIYSGKVWDITIDGGAFVARRDGKVFITGNCTQEQVQEEITKVLSLVNKFYSIFGFTPNFYLATRPEKAMGEKKLWDQAEKSLENSLKANKIKYEVKEKDGAFYGPKIDIHIKDAIGRDWQLATIQLDFQMPERFDLSYEGKDGKKHKPVMIHRAIFGSFERFIGILTEHFAGKFPLWLSPIQVILLNINEDNLKFANEVKNELIKNNIRVELDDRNESIPKKVREAQLRKIPLIVAIGDKEQQNKTLAVRTLDGKIEFNVKLGNFIEKIKKKINEKEL